MQYYVYASNGAWCLINGAKTAFEALEIARKKNPNTPWCLVTTNTDQYIMGEIPASMRNRIKR